MPAIWGGMVRAYLRTQAQLTAHKFWVFYFLTKFAGKLIYRGLIHDFSKYSNAEALVFAKQDGALAVTRYGTPEYDELLKKVQPALDHHYANNSHHPQYYINGVADMDILDKIEMACDSLAATKRTKDGDIRFSIEKNQDRFGYSDADKALFHAMVDELERRKSIRRKD